MGWLFLLVAIGLEVAGTTAMNLSDGFSKLRPSLLMFALYGGSLAMLNLALNHKIEIGARTPFGRASA
jgi:small multidrug resistance pump